MDWTNTLNQAGNVAQGVGFLNYNLNSYKNDNTFQGQLNQWGSGITGEDPIMKAIKTMSGTETNSLVKGMRNYVDSTPYANSTDQILNLYRGYQPLEHVKKESFGSLVGDNLLASAQGAKNGLSVGGAWGALAGGILGGVLNLGTAISHAGERDAMNMNIDYTNKLKAATMNNNVGSVNSLNNYLNKANVAAMGGQFTDGISEFDAGGTHEQNPKGGIQVGVGSNGLPNTVEEGEVRDNSKNYIYSNRLTASKEELEASSLSTKYANKTFADIAKLLSKELQDRPNDGSSRKSHEIMLSRLRNAQELKKSEIQKDIIVSMAKKYKVDPKEIESVLSESQGQQNQFAYGGYSDYPPRILPGEGPGDPANIKTFISNPYNYAYNNSMDIISKQPTNDEEAFLTTEDIPNNLTFTPGIIPTKKEKISNNSTEEGFNSINALMNSSILGNLIGLGSTIAKGKDYTFADKLLSMKPRTMAPALIHDRMSYDPVNSVFNQNQLLGLAANNRSKLRDASGGNAAVERASLLNADSNMYEALGKSILLDSQTNLERKKLASEFNRGTNQVNADSINKANMANMEAGAQNDQLIYSALMLKQKIKDDYENAISQNMTGLFDNMSSLGRYKFDNNLLAGLYGYTIGKDGKFTPVKK